MVDLKRKKNVWMPMYWYDYERDTSHLSALQHGAYLMLIKHLWCTRAPIPDDDRILRRLSECETAREWKNVRKVLEPFFIIEGGFWHHKRVDRELSRAELISQTRKISGGKRAAKPLENHDPPGANAEVLLPKNAESDQQNSTQFTVDKGKRERESLNPARPRSGIDPGPIVQRGCEILGVSLTEDTTRLLWPGEIGRLLDDGLDVATILEAFRIAKLRGRTTISYIVGIARSLKREGVKKTINGDGAPASVSSRDDQLRALVKAFRERGFWPKVEGPAPDDPDCCVDKAILAEFGFPSGKIVPLRPQK